MRSASSESSQDVRDAPHRLTTADQCVWCELPVPGRRGSVPQYCCYGCRLAHSLSEEKGDAGHLRWTVIRLGLAIFFTMNLMAFTMTMWSLDVYDVRPDPFQQSLYEVFRWLSMTLSIPVLLLLGLPMLTSALHGQRTNTFFADMLIVLGVSAAGIASAVNVVRGEGPVYFEVGAMILVMVTLGRWLEAEGKQKATAALDQFADLLPETAHRKRHDGTVDESVPSRSIRSGDLLVVRSGERFPVDATITHGEASIDEQIFTGESAPVFRNVGDNVLAGTVNLDGLLVVEAASLFREGSFGRLLNLLQEARIQRGHYQRLADRAAAWFLPAVVLIAGTTFVFHSSSGFGVAIQNSLSVLLIACPCALGLATPLAIWTAFSVAAKNQVLFRNGEAIERLAGISNLCVDKTGTLTTGQPNVRESLYLPSWDERTVAQLCLDLTATSNHPLSRAIEKYFQSESLPNRQHPKTHSLTQHKNVAGRGVEAALSDGRMLRLGQLEFAAEPTHIPSSVGTRIEESDASIVAVGIDGTLVAVFFIDEQKRGEAASLLCQLKPLQISATLLSGDRAERTKALVHSLETESCCSGSALFDAVYPELSPDNKVDQLKRIREQRGSTAMLGDGINDAPVLAAADVGIALGCGSDVARDSAAVCLLGNQLDRVAWSIRLARRTRSTIRQNLAWAFTYNSLGILLAASGMLNPAFAAALMIGSSLLVISNSLRLLSFDNDNHADSPTKRAHSHTDAQRDTMAHPNREFVLATSSRTAEAAVKKGLSSLPARQTHVGAGNAVDPSGDK